MMRKYWVMAVVAATLLTAACGTKERKMTDAEVAKTEKTLPGDSMLYGLVCNGSNDSILVFLPLTGEDPDTFDILEAWKEMKVFGRLMAGDNVAVMLNPEDKKIADLVVDLDKLKGEWCYLVKPQLRHHANFNPATLQPEIKEKMDSILEQMLQPQEYGVEIRSEHIARPIGMNHNSNSDKKEPVVFPPQKRYRMWYLFNGRLLLSETSRDSAGVSTVTNTDTAEIVLMRRDTLVLRFSDGEEKGYYRRGGK